MYDNNLLAVVSTLPSSPHMTLLYIPLCPCRQTHLQVKVGHGGTLDPMATGVLVIGVGKGCRELSKFLKVGAVAWYLDTSK